MQITPGFVERTHADTVVTIHPILDPEDKTLFRMDIPFGNPGMITGGRAFFGWFSPGNCLGWAHVRTFFTGSAEFRNSKRLVIIMKQRQVGKNFADPYPGPVFFRYQ